VREFGFWTADLHKMAEWPVACRIDTVAMQSAGVYWIPLDDILEKHGLRVVLVNARPKCSGRKTDVQACQWLMKTAHLWMAAGFLSPGTQPGRRAHGLESAGPARGRSRAQRAAYAKALIKMDVPLANVIRDVSGLTGQALVGALLGGERDPYKLAELSDPHIQASKEEVAVVWKGLGGKTPGASCSRRWTASLSRIRRSANVTPN